MASKQMLISDDNPKIAVASIESVENIICEESLNESRTATDECNVIIDEILITDIDNSESEGKDRSHVVIVGQVCDSRQGELVSTVMKIWSRLVKETSIETNRSNVSVHIIRTLPTNRNSFLEFLLSCDLLVLMCSELDDESFGSVCMLRQEMAEKGNKAPVVFIADKEDPPETQSSEETSPDRRRSLVVTEDRRKYVSRNLKGLLNRIKKSVFRYTLQGLELQNEVMAMLNIFSGFNYQF